MKNAGVSGKHTASGRKPEYHPTSLRYLQPIVWAAICMGLSTSSISAATVGDNPYGAIVVRNAFGLKPPPNPADTIKTPEPVSADIKLQGITTILGRPQVLLSVKHPGQPGKPVSEESLVLNEGQRDGDIVAVKIDVAQGIVTLKNGAAPLTLNMKEDAEKPTPGAAMPTAIHPPGKAIPGVLPTIPVRPTIPAAHSGGVGLTAFGGSSAQNVSGFGSSPAAPTAVGNAPQFNIPERTLRSSAANRINASAPNSQFNNLSPEAQAVLIEAQRANLTPGGFDPLPKTVITPHR